MPVVATLQFTAVHQPLASMEATPAARRGWVLFPTVAWDLSLCAPSRASMLTGLRWQRHGVYMDGLAGDAAPQDGSAWPFAYSGSHQPYNQISTLVQMYDGATPVTTGTITSVVIAATDEPILLTAGDNPPGTPLPGGKIGIGTLTGTPPTVTPDNLAVSSTTPILTSTTSPTTVPVTGSVGGSYSSGAHVSVQAYFPQQLMSAPGSPGYFDLSWDYSNSWPFALQQVGYQVAWFGKLLNSYPFLKGDAYVPLATPNAAYGITASPIFDRWLIILDDSDLLDQTDPTNNAYQTGQAYSGVDHTNHTEANYIASAQPFNFNNQGSLQTVSTATDSWTDATSPTAPVVNDSWAGTAGYAKRQTAPNTGYLTDFYNGHTIGWFNGDSQGITTHEPFAVMVATRSDHHQWTPAERHWCVNPANTPGLALNTGGLDNALAGGSTTVTWTTMPAITGRVTTNGIWVMIGAETVEVTGTSGTVGSSGTWTVTRNAAPMNDITNCLLQTGGSSPTWPVGSPVVLISSSASPDTGDNANFNETSAGTSSFWKALLDTLNTGTNTGAGNAMTAPDCVQARHDRIMKAKTGMAADELIYDIQHFCATTYANPTVVLVISDNGWSYGDHAQQKGKITPYRLARQGPIFINWPSGTAERYPYFSVRPNIVVVVVDDDDTESLSSGYPILNSGITGTELNCLASNLDIPATVCDLAGATPRYSLDGASLAPIASSARTGTSPRDYIQFSLRQSQENGYPSFQGIQTLDKIYWQWLAFAVSSYALQTGATAAQAAAGSYPLWEEGYDYTGSDTGFADPAETLNSVSGTGWTAPYPFSSFELATLQARLAASLTEVPNI